MDHTESDSATVVVRVSRTGGFAGLRRDWRAEPEPDDAPVFIELIERCPWDAVHDDDCTPPRGADRFVWRIYAHCDDVDREAELPDDELSGAWRALVDAVRAWPS